MFFSVEEEGVGKICALSVEMPNRKKRIDERIKLFFTKQ